MRDATIKYVYPALLTTLAIFAPIKDILFVTGFLIFADMITGVLAAIKSKEKIESSGLRRTVTKILVYNLAVISGFLVERYMVADLLPFSKIIAGAISVVELKSILENLTIINGKSIFKDIIVKLGSTNDEKKESSEELPK